jgi:hypothetical protein
MTKKPFVLDMETSDPDDFLTLLLLLGHPEVDLVGVTITPGTREQVGVVRQALAWFGRDIPVGAYDIDHVGECVSAWHYKAFPQLKKVLADADGPGWEVLGHLLGEGVTMVEGAAPKNLGALLARMSVRLYDREPRLGSLFFQGCFAGEGVVPPEKQLEKFRGKVTCPSFNPNGDPKATLSILDHRTWFEDLRFVSKNVCHGVKYDSEMHARFTAVSSTWCGHEVCGCRCHTHPGTMLHVMACCSPCSRCGQNVAGFEGAATSPKALSQSLIYQGMSYYLASHPNGKAFHDPLAACCAINPTIGEWASVDLYRERGEWGAFLLPASGVRIIVGYDHEKFVRTLLGGKTDPLPVLTERNVELEADRRGVQANEITDFERGSIATAILSHATGDMVADLIEGSGS